ncbi:MAG TPA: alpha/beta hydrolase [Rariglobus sp.]|jgi:acetyl esterase/lipase|nr:alpha/beta hydrolase [Rariglobus sp.]
MATPPVTHVRVSALRFLKQSLCCLTFLLPLGAVAQTPPVPEIPKGISLDGLPDNKVQEYKRGLSTRAKWVAHLPQGSATYLDTPYVEHAFQGKLPSSNQLLDLYVPPGKGPFPLIVYIHGGAWKGGNKENEGPELAGRWLPQGFAVASLNYRFVFDAQFPGMFQDCLDGIAYLRTHAAQYRINPNQVGVVGISAGAHIAAWVALTEGSSKYPNSNQPVSGVVLWAGFYDMTPETGHWNASANPRDDFSLLYPNRAYDPAIGRAMSPVYQIGANCPPVLIMHGDKDTTAPVAQSELFLDALKKAGKNVTYKTYPDYTHNLVKPDVMADTITFFRQVMK